MSSTPSHLSRGRRDRRAFWVRLIVIIDIVAVLAPPLHWMFGNGNPGLALGYLIGVALMVTLSLPVLHALSADAEEVPE
ncbi:hypothetical protein AB0E44_10595 [Micrococcus terreus]|uniref:hypothetical protein n=1 Tax=Micrococcus terreus TaxID=574650 RepID=UPI0033D69448